MSAELDKLNRLRANAGKNPLKSWKASQEALLKQIQNFEDDGFTDALPGAKIDAVPITDDPVVKAALDTPPPKLKDSALMKSVDKSKPVPATTKVKAHLARGLDTDTMAANSRLAVRIHREREKKAKGQIKLNKEDKQQIANEARDRKITGKVDEKKDPAKAKRQIEKVNAKQAARADKPKKEVNANEVTVSDIARELDIDPKVARAKLRRHTDKLAKLYAKGVTSGWAFPKSAKDALVKILKGG